MIDGLGVGAALHFNQFGQGYHSALGRGHGNLGERAHPAAAAARKDKLDLQGLSFVGHMHRGRRLSAHRRLQGMDNGPGGDPVECGLFPVHHKIDLFAGRLGHSIDIDHPGFIRHDLFDVLGRGNQFLIGFIRAGVKLGHNCGQHRRPRRHLHQLDFGLMFFGDFHEVVSYS